MKICGVSKLTSQQSE